jgi:hypothetical protein
MAQDNLKRSVRTVIHFWVNVSAMSAPLVWAYNSVLSRGHWFPTAGGTPSVLTVITNVCLFAGSNLCAGLMVSMVLVGNSVYAEPKFLYHVITYVFYPALIFTFFFGRANERSWAWGSLIFAFFVLRLPLIRRWVEPRLLVLYVSIATVVAICLIFTPFEETVWEVATDQDSFQFVTFPPSNYSQWVTALVGAGCYIYCYIRFKNWISDGGWSKELLNDAHDRRRGSPES